MSYYEPQPWQQPVRQSSWEQPPPPSRSGASSTSQREETSAFASQFEEVDRAIDNLVKSGKIYGPGPRRDPVGMAGGPRHYNEHNPRVHGGRHSIGSEFDPARSHSTSNLQNFYASQRYGRPTDAEQMQQAKRRMAAQRERELRNYHQEQQYNRSVMAEMASNKSDRSMSPSTLSEEGRRELIARQHRALYGDAAAASAYMSPGGFNDENNREQAPTNSTSAASGIRGTSPRGMDPFGMPGQEGSQPGAGAQESRSEELTAPTAGSTANKAPTPPMGEDGHSRQVSKSTTAPAGGMGPIGSRPTTQQAPSQGLNKRSTTPNMNFGFGSDQNGNERAQSSNSNSNNQKDQNDGNPGIGAWGTGSGVWGSNKIGATSVWG